MTLIVSKLYLIEIVPALRLIQFGAECRRVALIPAKDPSEAIDKYIARTGFDSNYRYLCSYLITNTIEINTSSDHISEYYFIAADTKTISGNHLRIDSYEIANYSDLFNMVDPKDVNDWLFIRPAIDEARNCVGFSNTPTHELRKFCI